MKAKLILIAAGAVLLGTLALAPPAQAAHPDWSFGVGFHVGGLHFRVGLAPAGYGGYPGPFFLTTSRISYPGYGCGNACFRSGAGYYHHASCPLLGFHLRRVGYGPDHFVTHYSPYRSYGSSPGLYRNRSYGYYYRDGYRDRFRSPGSYYYRGDRHRRDTGRGRHWGSDHDHDSDSDRGRHYRDDRRGDDRQRGDRSRRGAARTRPPG